MKTEVKKNRVLDMSPEAPVFAPEELGELSLTEADRHDDSTLSCARVGNSLGLPSENSSEPAYDFDVNLASEKTLSPTEYPPYDESKHWRSIEDLREGIWYSFKKVPMDDSQLHKYFCLKQAPYPKDLDYKYKWDPRDHPNISDKDLFTLETLRSDSAMWPIALQIELALEDELERFHYMPSFFSAIVQRLYEDKNMKESS